MRTLIKKYAFLRGYFSSTAYSLVDSLVKFLRIMASSPMVRSSYLIQFTALDILTIGLARIAR
jgi:hypothetical protein